MEFIGRSMPEDFEEFLAERRINLCDRGKLDEKIPETDIRALLMEKGMPQDEARGVLADIFSAMGHNMRAAYAQGVKDGAKLMLHLLGMAPENRKEVS